MKLPPDRFGVHLPRRSLYGLAVVAVVGIVAIVATMLHMAAPPVTATTSFAGSGSSKLFALPTARPTPTPVPTSLASDFITRVIARTNLYRREYAPQCPQLVYEPHLTEAAYLHSKDMALHGVLSHTGSDGSTVPERLEAAGYHFSTWAENINWYWPAPEETVDKWFDETPPNDGHRLNILGCTLTQVGVGVYVNPTDPAGMHIYWTEDFGSST